MPQVSAPRNAVASTFPISVYPTAATRVWSAVQPSARKSWTSCGTSFARCSALPPGTPMGGESDGRWSMTRRRLAAVGEVKSSATHGAIPTSTEARVRQKLQKIRAVVVADGQTDVGAVVVEAKDDLARAPDVARARRQQLPDRLHTVDSTSPTRASSFLLGRRARVRVRRQRVRAQREE